MSENNDKQLAKFNLCKSLVELLGVEQATADLYKLYHRHPEMFKNEDDLKTTIEQVLNKPDLITKNPRPQSVRDFMAYKQSRCNNALSTSASDIIPQDFNQNQANSKQKQSTGNKDKALER